LSPRNLQVLTTYRREVDEWVVDVQQPAAV
jgi:hypothetical protein